MKKKKKKEYLCLFLLWFSTLICHALIKGYKGHSLCQDLMEVIL
jgi:hypothetical protein